MFLVWPIVLAVMLGLFCSMWARLPAFMVIVFVGAVGSMFSMWMAGRPATFILLGLPVVLTALEGGYLLGLLAQSRLTDPPRENWRAVPVKFPETTEA
jgi:predicted signal transduction protein with EAL and GGDEF domain